MTDKTLVTLTDGLQILVDPTKWCIESGLSFTLMGDENEVVLDVRVREIEDNQPKRLEGALVLRQV